MLATGGKLADYRLAHSAAWCYDTQLDENVGRAGMV